MPPLRLTLCFALPALLTAAPGYARDQTDGCQRALGAAIADLPAAVAKHEKELNERYDELLGAYFRGQWLLIGDGSGFCNADMERAALQDARLAFADFRGAQLRWSNLSGAVLERSDLTGAKLRGANLSASVLQDASLRGAYLQHADLSGANLSGTDLTGADLTGANLEGAILFRTIITDAKLEFAQLSGAQYETRGLPSPEWMASISGVARVSFCENEESAMVRLRSVFRNAGLRKLEREATYALERHRTAYALAGWDPPLDTFCGSVKQDRWAAVEGAFRLVFFEWTTGYGMAYGRPILILLGLIAVFTLFYLPAIARAPNEARASGVFRVWPQGRIELADGRIQAAGETIVEPLHVKGIRALPLAFYFSVISAFHLGWRDLNVGTWMARLQPRDYALRARGWPRAISGLQSLISVYLLAMWALTYFGRPFE